MGGMGDHHIYRRTTLLSQFRNSLLYIGSIYGVTDDVSVSNLTAKYLCIYDDSLYQGLV